jgi:hypothetical protein
MAATKANEWKGKAGTDLPLPSGNTAECRQIDPSVFLQGGFLPDPLSKLVREAISTRQGLPPKKVQEIADDPKQLMAAMELFDRVLTHCVIQPKVEMPPTCVVIPDGEHNQCGLYANKPVHTDPGFKNFHKYQEGDRDPDTLYADEVSLLDKQHVFQWALGGVRDVEPFREQLAGVVESVSDGQDVPDATLSADGDPERVGSTLF